MSAIRFCVHALGLYLLFCGSFLAAQEGELHRYLVEQLDEVDWSKLEPRDQIQNYLGVSKALMTTGKEELAQVVQGDAISKIESEDDPQFDQMVFEHAIETNQLELAESFARKLNREYITDRLTAAKIRSGDVNAYDIDDYQATNFHTAVDVGKALGEIGEYEKMEELVSSMQFHKLAGDRPATAQAVVYNEIALRVHKAGDSKRAKLYIDKAMEVGGKHFYSDFAMEIDRRVIYGELKKDFKQFAQRAANYPDHMGRELVQNYARALRENGIYNEAKQVVEYLDKPKDKESCLSLLATEQANRGDFDEARKTIETLGSKPHQFHARVMLAVALYKSKHFEEAEKLKVELESEFQNDERPRYSFAYLLGVTNDLQRVKKYLSKCHRDTEKTNYVRNVFKGISGGTFH